MATAEEIMLRAKAASQAPGAKEYQALLDGGFSQDEAEAWKMEQSQTLARGGFTPNEISNYWGDIDPTKPSVFDATVRQNMRANWLGDAKVADDPMEMLQAGWDMSVAGLLSGKPTTVAPEHAGTFGTIMAAVGQFAGDLPATVAGFVGGAAAGGTIGGAAGAETGPGAAVTAVGGAAIGGGAGAAALPEAIRQVKIDAYKNGEIISWSDAVERAQTIIWNTAKAAAIGGVTAPIGGIAGKQVLNETGSLTRAALANGTSQALAGTALMGAVEGRVPDADDFVAATALVMGFHAAGATVGATKRFALNDRGKVVNSNMMDVYARTGIAPWEQAELAQRYPELRQALGAVDVDGDAIVGPFRDHAPDEPLPFGMRGSQEAKPAVSEPGALPAKEEGEGKTNALRIRAEHDLEVEQIETKAMERAFNAQFTPDQQLGIISRLERSANFARQHGISEHEVVSSAGAIGRYQIMPSTGKLYGYSRQDLFDPAKNREAAGKILKDLTNKYRFTDGSIDMEAVLIAYNAGPGRANKFRSNGRDYSQLPRETQKYLERANSMGIFRANPMHDQPGSEAYGIRHVDPMNLNMKQFIDAGAKGKIASRMLDSGEIVPDENAVASYLKKFGHEAGFKFLVGPSEDPDAATFSMRKRSHSNVPHYAQDRIDHTAYGVRITGRYDRVYIPDTPEELNRRWYGLGRSEILHHEVGHALHYKVLGKVAIPNEVIRAEMKEASRNFRPMFWSEEGVRGVNQQKYVLTPSELFADTIATYMTNPTARMRMPEFVKAYGEKLDKYKEFIDRNLPRRKEGGGGWEPPPGGNGAGDEQGNAGGTAGTGGGAGKPPAPPANTSVGPAGPPPGKGPKALQLSEDILRAKIEDIIADPDNPGLLDRGRDLTRSMMMRYISELDPFRRYDFEMMAERRLSSEEVGLEDMFRSTYASKDRGGMFLTDGAFDAIKFEKKSDVSVTRAFETARKKGGDEYGFITYMIAKRTVEKAAQNIDAAGIQRAAAAGENPYFTLEEAQRYIELAKGKYEEAAGVLRDSQHWLFEYERESGVYNRGQIARMKEKNKYYIPFKRDLEGEGVSINIPRGRGFAIRQTLKQMKGSDRQIVEPVMALVEAYMTRVAMADRNRAIGALIGSAERGEITNVKRIEDKRPAMEYIDPKGRVHKIDWNQPLPPEFDIASVAALNLMRGSKLGGNEFIYIREGVPELWSVDDPDIAKVIRGMPAGDAGAITKVLRFVASLKRSGITQDPGYMLRNIARDAQSGAILERMGGLPFQNFMAGFWDVVGNTETYKQFVREGGMGAALASMDANHVRANVEKIFQETGTISAVTNYARHPIDALRMLTERSDAISRLGAWKRAGGGFKAAMGSRKLSLDFAERGTSDRLAYWAGITPFLRPTLLGIKQLGEAFSTRPTATAAKIMAYLMVPTVMFYGLNYASDKFLDDNDPQKWQNMPRWIRDNYFVIPMPGGGEKLKVPKPPAIGPIMGGLLERTLDYMLENDKDAFEGFMDTFLKQFVPPMIPAALEPVAEDVTNYSFFKGKPLIPPSLEDASGWMQFTPYTSETAKAISRVLGPLNSGLLDTSPVVIDNYIRQWGGTLGTSVVKLLDAPFVPDRPYEWADNPFVGSFFIRHDMGGEMIERFYEKAKEVTKARRDLALAKGREDEAMLDYTADQTQAYMRIDEIKQSLAMQRSAVEAIRNDRDMTNDEKRQMTDELTRGMIETARVGVEMLDSVK